VILIDTSVLVDSLTANRRSLPALRRVFEQGEKIAFSTIVLYEWLRGPRSPEELSSQEFFLPSVSALPYEPEDARISAKLYRAVKRARGREADLAIAACAIRHDAELWTLNTADFSDIPGLHLKRK
jgi:predicted nucleic acid-binding protein